MQIVIGDNELHFSRYERWREHELIWLGVFLVKSHLTSKETVFKAPWANPDKWVGRGVLHIMKTDRLFNNMIEYAATGRYVPWNKDDPFTNKDLENEIGKELKWRS